MSGFKPGSTLAPPADALTPDNKPAAPGLVEALTAFAKFVDEQSNGAVPIWIWLANFNDEHLAALSQPVPSAPIDMVLHCPKCGEQHIDGPAPWSHPVVARRWDNPPHRSHLCHNCGHIWRPADVPTNGVAAVKTKGKEDSPIAVPSAPEPSSITAELLADLKMPYGMVGTRDVDVTAWNAKLDRAIAALSSAPPVPAAASAVEPALAFQPKPMTNVVPGKVHCAKCGFTLVRTNLYVNSGTTGPGGEETEPCPNDGNPMLPITWEAEAREAWARCEEMFERAVAAEKALASLPASPEPATQGAAEHPAEVAMERVSRLASWLAHNLSEKEWRKVRLSNAWANFESDIRQHNNRLGRPFMPDVASPAPEPATQGAAKPVHTGHPFQHWDRTCPACVLEASPPVPEPLTPAAGEPDERVLNLLARIHRDGGHYVAEHGLHKALQDAESIVIERIAALDEIAALTTATPGLSDAELGSILARIGRIAALPAEKQGD